MSHDSQKNVHKFLGPAKQEVYRGERRVGKRLQHNSAAQAALYIMTATWYEAAGVSEANVNYEDTAHYIYAEPEGKAIRESRHAKTWYGHNLTFPTQFTRYMSLLETARDLNQTQRPAKNSPYLQ